MVAFVAAFVLTACGAEVNTQLTLQDDYSGQRQFVMTMADSDVQHLTGGVDAAAQALEIHSPDVLTFEGLEEETEGYSATFTMEFDGVDDYRNKITALLDASEVPESDREMDITIDEQQLVTSIVFEEDFYNDDLMGWTADALVQEEVVPDNTTVLTSGGAASVTYDGEDVDTSTSLPRINFSLTDDRRFSEIGMDLEILESGNFQIAMSYLVSPDDTAIHNEFIDARIEQLNDLDEVDGAVEDSGPAENHGSGDAEAREITVTFASADAVEQGMQIMLANDAATFEVTDTVDDASPDVITEYSGSQWTCETICNPSNIQQLDGETVYPDHWQLVDQRRGNGDFYVEFNRGMPLDSLTSTTKLGFAGAMAQSFEFVIADETLEGHEEAVAERFEPADGLAAFDTVTRDGKTIYTTSFQADNAAELAEQLNAYLEDKGITETVEVHHEPLTGLWAHYDLNMNLSALWELVTGGVEDTATFQVDLPILHSGTNNGVDSSGGTIVLEESSGNFSVTASGPTMTTLWVGIVVIGLLVLAIVAYLIWRRRATHDASGFKSRTSEHGKPYYVQGRNDDLTESQILRSPLAPGALGDPGSPTADVAPIADPERTRIYDQSRPFPDVPIPSVTTYEQLQERGNDADDHAAASDAGTDAETDVESDPTHDDEQK